MESVFRDELLQVLKPTRGENGCLRIDMFETVRAPVEFAIHSVWMDEASFERHGTYPHTKRFVDAAERLLTHPIEGLRMHSIT